MQQLNVEQIETKRLLLKRFTPADFIFTFENYSDEEIKQILGLKTEEALENERNK